MQLMSFNQAEYQPKMRGLNVPLITMSDDQHDAHPASNVLSSPVFNYPNFTPLSLNRAELRSY